MKQYDYIILGGGTAGLTLLSKALKRKARTALINKGPLGGTCLNVGCVPSKMLIYPADVIQIIRESGKLGIDAAVRGIDLNSIMERMRTVVKDGRELTEDYIRGSKDLDFYDGECSFTGLMSIKVNGETLKGKKIFIATGGRPMIPAIDGLESVDYLTNETVLGLKELPESIIIIGGGYIAVEYGHFFAAMGTRVIILQRSGRLVPHEEPEISDLLARELGKRVEIHLNMVVNAVSKHESVIAVSAKDHKSGEEKSFSARRVMLAAGRRSNSDRIRAERCGIETDERGYIKVNEFLETNVKNVWSFGDAIGKQMFTHAGDKEAEVAWLNATGRKKIRMDFDAVPHAIYTWPQIASVGLTEEQARKGHEVLVGKAGYSDIAKGDAMQEKEGFAKAVVDKETGVILGFHIIGPDAPVLIQEAANAVAAGEKSDSLADRMHVFPSLSELIPEALGKAR